MKRPLFILTLITTLLSACLTLPPDDIYPPEATETPDFLLTRTPPSPGPADVAAGTPLPGTSYESRRYLDEAAGFTLDLPAGWTVNETVIGDRGTQIQFLSSPGLTDMATLSAGATRVAVTVYQWDPKNDLPAYAAHWKTAWEASGFAILEEEPLVLNAGLPAVQFTVQTPDARLVFLVASLNDQYLVLSGEGDLDLAEEFIRTLRPVSR